MGAVRILALAWACWLPVGAALPIIRFLRLAPAVSTGQTPRPPGPAARRALEAQGINHFFNLEYSQAIAVFAQLTQAEPESAAGWNHLSQAELYREMYRIGALQSQLYGPGDPIFHTELLPPDPGAVGRFLAANRRAMVLARAAINAQPHDAHAHYNLAAAWGLRGTLDFTVEKAYWKALGDARAARREAAAAERDAPDFVDPRLILGVQNYVAGSLPWTVKWLSSLVGYRGNKEKGRAQIADVAEHGEQARIEARVLLAVLDRRDGLNRQAAPILQALSKEFPRNVLFAVETGDALEAAGEHDAARAQYMAVIEHARQRRPGYQNAPLDRVWYAVGGIDRLYSRWKAAAADFGRISALPHPRRQYAQAAALAAGQMQTRAGDLQAARAEFERCIGIDPTTAAAREAERALQP